ncbi:MAG: Lrp/AsnC family transcriptional regulator [Candidatus Saliniplasma sp.]
MANIDDIDRRILKILENNSRTPFTEIANVLDISEATVRNRVRALEDDGVIDKFTIDVDPKSLGYGMVTIIGLDVEPQNLLTAVERLSDIQEVRWVAKSTGDHMIMTEVWTKDGEELSKIISEKMGTIEGLKDIKPAILLERKDKDF